MEGLKSTTIGWLCLFALQPIESITGAFPSCWRNEGTDDRRPQHHGAQSSPPSASFRSCAGVAGEAPSAPSQATAHDDMPRRIMSVPSRRTRDLIARQACGNCYNEQALIIRVASAKLC